MLDKIMRKEKLSEAQSKYRFARNNAAISVLVFFCVIVFALPNITGAAVGNSRVFIGPALNGTAGADTGIPQKSMSIKAYAIDWNDNSLKNLRDWKLFPDGNPNMTVYVRPDVCTYSTSVDKQGRYRTGGITKNGGVPYTFQVLGSGGKLSEQYNHNKAYIYYSPKSVFENYVKLRQEYDQKSAVLNTDEYLKDKDYYLASMSWCEAYLTECLGQDKSRIWSTFSKDRAFTQPKSASEVFLTNNYSPIQFHMMPEWEDVYRFPVLRVGDEGIWDTKYDPLHTKAQITQSVDVNNGGYFTYVTISDSPVVVPSVYEGYVPKDASSILPGYSPTSAKACYYAVFTNTAWAVSNRLEKDSTNTTVDGKDIELAQTDLANQTYDLISTEAYKDSLTNPFARIWVGIQQLWNMLLGGSSNYIQDINVESNLIGWAWDDQVDNNLQKVEKEEDDPNALIDATVSNRAIYTGKATYERIALLQKPEYAGSMPHPQPVYTSLKSGVDNYLKYQGFKLDAAATSISMSDMLEGLDIGGYYGKLMRDFANSLLSWSQPAMVNLLTSNQNFVPQSGGTVEWMNRLVRGLNSPHMEEGSQAGYNRDLLAQNPAVNVYDPNLSFAPGSGNEFTLGGYFRKSQMMAQVLLVLFILWTVLKVLTSDWSGNQVESVTELRDMIPRAFFAAIMIGINGKGGGVVFASLIWWVNDVVCNALLDPQTMTGFYTVFPTSLAETVSFGEGLTFAIMGIIMSLSYIALICVYILRAMGIWVLVLFMPWAWMCSMTKTTQKFTQTWISMWTGTIGIQFLHAIMLLGFISILNTQELADIMFGSVLQSASVYKVGAATTDWNAAYNASNYATKSPFWMMLAAVMMFFIMIRVSSSVFGQALYSGRGAVQFAQGMARSMALSYPMRRMMRGMMSGGRGKTSPLQGMRNMLNGRGWNAKQGRGAAAGAFAGGAAGGAAGARGGGGATAGPATSRGSSGRGGQAQPTHARSASGRADAFGGHDPRHSGSGGVRPNTSPTLNPFSRNPNRPNAWSMPVGQAINSAVGGNSHQSFKLGMGAGARGIITGNSSTDASINAVTGASDKGWTRGQAIAAKSGGNVGNQTEAVNEALTHQQQKFVDRYGDRAAWSGEEIARTISDTHATGGTIDASTLQFMKDSAALNGMASYAQDLNHAQGVLSQTSGIADISERSAAAQNRFNEVSSAMSDPASNVDGWATMPPQEQQALQHQMAVEQKQLQAQMQAQEAQIQDAAQSLGQEVYSMPPEVVSRIETDVFQAHLATDTQDTFGTLYEQKGAQFDSMLDDVVRNQNITPDEAIQLIDTVYASGDVSMMQNLLPEDILTDMRKGITDHLTSDDYDIAEEIAGRPDQMAGFIENALTDYLHSKGNE